MNLAQDAAAKTAGVNMPQIVKHPLLFIAPYFLPRNYGGAARTYDLLLSQARSFQSTVLTERLDADPQAMAEFDRRAPSERGYAIQRFDRLSLHFSRTSCIGNLLDAAQFYFSTTREFSALIAKIKPSVAVSGGAYRDGWLMNKLPPGIRKICFVLGEELTMPLEYGPIARWMRREQIKAYQQADLNLVISRFSIGQLQSLAGIPDEKIRLFPCFVDTERFRPPTDRAALRRKLGWDGKTVLLSLARLIPRKGIDQTLRALAQARSLPKNWLYVIAGRGPEEEKLRELAGELGLAHRVQFAGFVADEQVPELYGAADLYLQTNREVDGDTEGFGIVFLEANACGTAVIGGQAGGVGDAIQHNVSGLQVDADKVDEISLAIEQLLNSPVQRQGMAEAGLQRVQHHHTMQALTARFEELIIGLRKH